MQPTLAGRRPSRRATGLSIVLVLVGTAAACDSSGPSGGGGPGISFVPVNTPVDLTPDGRTALLMDLLAPAGDLFFYDTETGDLTPKTTIGSPLRDFATGISANGRIVGLHGDPVQAGYWDEATGWTDLISTTPGGCDQDLGSAWDVSANSKVVVGSFWNGCSTEGFRWEETSGPGTFTALELLGASFPGSSNPPSNRATVVSDNGRVSAGWAQTDMVDRWPAIWRADGSGFLLPYPLKDWPGEVLSISADGAVVAGNWNQQGFTWNQHTGVEFLGSLPTALPGDPVYPNAMTADGRIIFGGQGSPFFSLPAAFVWTRAKGMRSLQEVATAAGIAIPEGYFLMSVLAASQDGSVLLGSAADPGFAQVSFVLRLPAYHYEF